MTDEPGDTNPVALSLGDLALLLDALDSHEYWQIGDVLPRNDGVVWIPGDTVGPSDRYWHGEEPTDEQAEAIEQVLRCRHLAERIRAACVAR